MSKKKKPTKPVQEVDLRIVKPLGMGNMEDLMNTLSVRMHTAMQIEKEPDAIRRAEMWQLFKEGKFLIYPTTPTERRPYSFAELIKQVRVAVRGFGVNIILPSTHPRFKKPKSQ